MRIRNTWLALLAFPLIGSTTLFADRPHGFVDPPPRTVTAAPFSDAEIDDLLSRLDGLLAEDASSRQAQSDAQNDLWTFRERLQMGQLSDAQQAAVAARLSAAAVQHKTFAAAIGKERVLVRTLAVGQPAPHITGADLDGRPFRLSDYRGTVVVLAFSGEWCGACRVEYPYQRLLQELYKDRPLTILSVNSDKDPGFAKAAKQEHGLTYRSWWDGGADENTHGPIATAWGVRGWPTTYLLDANGTIRFVNLRQEDLLKGVKQLMSEGRK